MYHHVCIDRKREKKKTVLLSLHPILGSGWLLNTWLRDHLDPRATTMAQDGGHLILGGYHVLCLYEMSCMYTRAGNTHTHITQIYTKYVCVCAHTCIHQSLSLSLSQYEYYSPSVKTCIKKERERKKKKHL